MFYICYTKPGVSKLLVHNGPVGRYCNVFHYRVNCKKMVLGQFLAFVKWNVFKFSLIVNDWLQKGKSISSSLSCC
ncbi:hypothetical protein XELAEV_18013304mg [Xenopus laevis]|uniref:Uncharacterized protein n=1 Tax=Xenopus laevis TaxID=8355 RepID=A0A974DRF0_XENLA|nr:hypothetical protein XELAEV_18013304mg [Xenopus laevis]